MQLEPDDPQIGYMLQAWARICSVLKQHFIPYLGVVVPPLLRSAALKPEVNVVDGAGKAACAADSGADGGAADQEEELREQEGWETVVIGDKVRAGPAAGCCVGVAASDDELFRARPVGM
jgi:hypothetical protein